MVKLIPDDLNALIDFVVNVFDAEMDSETRFSDGTLMHACYKTDSGSIMIGQSNPRCYSGVTYAEVIPPSTTNSVPFTYDDSSLAR